MNKSKGLTLSLTNLCNTRCTFCYRRESREPHFFPFSEYVKLLDGIPFQSVEFSGIGEPLLHPDFQRFTAYTKRKYFGMQVVTNGELIDKYDLSGFSQVWVSLNAVTRATHEKVMPHLDFEHIISNINKVHSVALLTFVVTKDNYQEVEAFVRLGLDLGVKRIAVRSVDRALNQEIYDKEHVTKEQFEKIYNRLSLMATWHIGKRFLDLAPKYTFWEDSKQPIGNKIWCSNAEHQVGVFFTSGEVSPCCYLAAHIEKYPIANIYHDSANVIRSRLDLFNQSLRNGTSLPICKTCLNFWGKRNLL